MNVTRDALAARMPKARRRKSRVLASRRLMKGEIVHEHEPPDAVVASGDGNGREVNVSRGQRAASLPDGSAMRRDGMGRVDVVSNFRTGEVSRERDGRRQQLAARPTQRRSHDSLVPGDVLEQAFQTRAVVLCDTVRYGDGGAVADQPDSQGEVFVEPLTGRALGRRLPPSHVTSANPITRTIRNLVVLVSLVTVGVNTTRTEKCTRSLRGISSRVADCYATVGLLALASVPLGGRLVRRRFLVRSRRGRCAAGRLILSQIGELGFATLAVEAGPSLAALGEIQPCRRSRSSRHIDQPPGFLRGSTWGTTAGASDGAGVAVATGAAGGGGAGVSLAGLAGAEAHEKRKTPRIETERGACIIVWASLSFGYPCLRMGLAGKSRATTGLAWELLSCGPCVEAFLRKYFWSLDATVIAVCAALLGAAASGFVASRFLNVAAPHKAARIAMLAKAETPPRSKKPDAILRRNIFCSKCPPIRLDGDPEPAPVADEVVLIQPQATSLPLRLPGGDVLVGLCRTRVEHGGDSGHRIEERRRVSCRRRDSRRDTDNHPRDAGVPGQRRKDRVPGPVCGSATATATATAIANQAACSGGGSSGGPIFTGAQSGRQEARRESI